MHPILSRPGRLALYLAGWLPLGAILAALLAGGAGWLEAVSLAAPLSVLNAFVCLSAFYVCRYPVGPSQAVRLYLSPVLASLVGGAICAGGAGLIAGALDGVRGSTDFTTLVRGQTAVLFGLGALYYLLSIVIHMLLLNAEASAVAEREAAQSRALASEAELRALKAQINPHFLFNSLNSIAALTSVDPARAREMCVLLGDFLRSSLKLADAPSIPLEQEMSLVRKYLAIEQVRFGARLRYEEAMGENCAACLAPLLLLQPLVENAVKHGIAHLLDGGSIRVEVRNTGARVRVAVENDFDPEPVCSNKGGLGLENVRRRLKARYGEESEFEVRKVDGRFRVELSFLARTGGER
jgi:two-component system, LytTR family, sensor histidine kinase AlgZ